MQKGNTYTTTEQRCETVYDPHETPAGYDVVYMLDGMGVKTGVDMEKLLAATNAMSVVLGKPPVSRVASALNAKKRRAT